MATYDNKHWLLSHIRNSFISTDDTALCETVMLAEDLPKLLHSRNRLRCAIDSNILNDGCNTDRDDKDSDEEHDSVMEFDCYPDMENSDEEDIDPLTESFDLQHDMDFGLHSGQLRSQQNIFLKNCRQRSNTAQRIEKMEQAQRKAAKIKVVKWEMPVVPLTEEERHAAFPKKDITANSTKITRKSLLSEQLEMCPFLPQSQYMEFAKYDGTAQLGQPTKSFKIFMTMMPEDQRNYPIEICILGSAKIKDVVGFICYKYSVAHPEVLMGPVANYALYICEDDGEVDWDFPCLDPSEVCSKFGFNCLGLVDVKNNPTVKHNAEMHTSSIPEKGGLNAIILTDDPKSQEQSRRTTIDREGQIANFFSSMRAGKNGRHGSSSVTFADIPMAASSVRGQSVDDHGKSSSPQETEALIRMKVHEMVIEAPLYQSFKVRLANKVRASTHVLLGISGERIEIDPLYAGSHKFWPRMKPVSYNIDSVAWCELLETKSSKATFRLVYSMNQPLSPQSQEPLSHSGFIHHGFLQSSMTSFKHHDFECDFSTATEIVEKINRILDIQSSPCRKEYKAARDRKSVTRRSFHLSKNLNL